jgi:Ca2+-binding EF-hand superfamily protein
MNLKANKELKSIPKQVLIKALHSFGFDASTNLLNEILKFEEFIEWPRFVSLMETLIHKNSA